MDPVTYEYHHFIIMSTSLEHPHPILRGGSFFLLRGGAGRPPGRRPGAHQPLPGEGQLGDLAGRARKMKDGCEWKSRRHVPLFRMEKHIIGP